MPRPKNSNAMIQRLEKQIAQLQKELKESQRDIEQSRERHAEEIDEAANLGYEMGCLDAEEREIRRAEVVAEAIARFEESYEKHHAVNLEAIQPAKKQPKKQVANVKHTSKAPKKGQSRAVKKNQAKKRKTNHAKREDVSKELEQPEDIIEVLQEALEPVLEAV